MSEAPDALDWQQDFIATNLLAIGYNAWVGYLGGDRSAIICSINSPGVGIAIGSTPFMIAPSNPQNLATPD